MQVPTATGLTVRVINNVVKKMDVKPRFYDAFRKDGYQGTNQFKQKVCPACILASDPAQAILTRLHAMPPCSSSVQHCRCPS